MAAIAFGALFTLVLLQLKPGDIATLPRAFCLLAAFIVLGLLIRGVYPPPNLQVSVFEKGVAVVYPDGSWKAIHYDSVDSVWYVVPTYFRFFKRRRHIEGLVLVTKEGRKLPLPLGVVDRASVFRSVHTACTQPLVALSEEALAAGEELVFGAVRFSKHDLFLHRERIPWTDIRLAVRAGVIALERNGTRIGSVTNDGVPHPRLFSQLVRQLAAHVEIVDQDHASGW